MKISHSDTGIAVRKSIVWLGVFLILVLTGCHRNPAPVGDAVSHPVMPDPGDPDEFLSADTCSKISVGDQAGMEVLTASDFPGDLNLRSGGSIEVERKLTCAWEEEYQSEYKVGRISFTLQISKLKTKTMAEELVANSKLIQQKAQEACLEDAKLCQVTEATFGSERILYSESTIYNRGDGTVLPSSSYGELARSVQNDAGIFFITATVIHPERERGDPWVEFNILYMEDIALEIIGE